MSQPPQAPRPAAAPQKGGIDEELKRIVQYISQVYQVQKKQGEQIAALEKRIDQLDKAIGNIMTAAGKAVTDGLAPVESRLAEVIDRSIQTAIAKQVLPQLRVATPAPAPAPRAAPTTAPTPSPTSAPTPPPTTEPRRPSDVPDARVATVIEALDQIVSDLKSRQRVQREYLKPLIEQARDTAMNNLSSRAKAASSFKELIALLKSSPSDLPPDTLATVIAKLEELSMHIRTL
ncbi:MAG: hypothetical protein ACFE89_03520 [Candidatus Hodarchaeota archaeon]